MSFYWHKFVLAVNAVWHCMYHHWEETVIFEVSLLLLLQRLLRFESECTSLFSRNNPETMLKECSLDDSNPDTFWVFLTPFTWSSRLRYQALLYICSGNELQYKDDSAWKKEHKSFSSNIFLLTIILNVNIGISIMNAIQCWI